MQADRPTVAAMAKRSSSPRFPIAIPRVGRAATGGAPDRWTRTVSGARRQGYASVARACVKPVTHSRRKAQEAGHGCPLRIPAVKAGSRLGESRRPDEGQLKPDATRRLRGLVPAGPVLGLGASACRLAAVEARAVECAD